MNDSITLMVDLPESLHRSLCDFLDSDPNWDCNQVFSVALFQFLQPYTSSSIPLVLAPKTQTILHTSVHESQ